MRDEIRPGIRTLSGHTVESHGEFLWLTINKRIFALSVLTPSYEKPSLHTGIEVTHNWDFHIDRKAAGGRRARHQRLRLFVVGQVSEVRRARKAALREVNENFFPQSGAILLLLHCH